MSYSAEQTTISSVEDINALTGVNLLNFYNQLTGKGVRKFSDRQTGLKRTVEAWQTLGSKPTDFEIRHVEEATPSKANAVQPKATKTKTPKATKTKKATKADSDGTGTRHKPFNYPAQAEVKNHRDGTHRAKIIAILLKGATIQDVQKVTGWTLRNSYDGVRMLHVQVGYGIKEDDKGVIKIFA